MNSQEFEVVALELWTWIKIGDHTYIILSYLLSQAMSIYRYLCVTVYVPDPKTFLSNNQK